MAGANRPCCTPARAGTAGDPAAELPVFRSAGGIPGATDAGGLHLVPLAAARFRMGTNAPEGFPADGEGPAREVELSAFRIATTTVTNAAFARFVQATGHVTQAERAGSSFVFYLQVPKAVRDTIRRVPRGLPWWLDIAGADWRHPEGPGSQLDDRADHPVVHVSWDDAQAYCAWSGTRLPTEAQWEYAARGGLVQARYPWGQEHPLQGEPRCQIWRGEFPNRPAAGWQPGTVRADAHAPNGHGLYNMAGNVWEWCADWFSPDAPLTTAARDPLQHIPTGQRAMRGGSFLCHDSYCNRYRVAARSSSTPTSSASNVGFRVSASITDLRVRS